MKPRIRGFSVVELLVSIGIIAGLIIFAFAGLQSLRDRGIGIRCIANLKQIGAATAAYAGENRGDFPYYHYLPGVDQVGSGAAPGTWFYNLAPYLGVPRYEPATAAAVHEEKTRLGTPQQRITAPCVFTCPGHRKSESSDIWKPEPMTFPALVPVSYAPSTTMGTVMTSINRTRLHPSGYTLYSIRISDVIAPGRKIWLSDSPLPHLMNVSDARWRPATEYAANFPHQAFTRHSKGGNALFFDGHVEWIPLTRFTNHRLGINHAVARYFHPTRDPNLDE